MMFYTKKYDEAQQIITKNASNAKIVAISKFHSKDSVIKAIKYGVKIFGENRVQEAQKKFFDLKNIYKGIELHLTGPLQTNKVKQALKIFDFFQTLDRKKLADEFAKNTELTLDKKFFIQINTGKESTKAGIYPENANEFINYCVNDLRLNIIGLMCLPPINDSPIDHFRLLKSIALKNNLEHLSMGMTEDYEVAIKEGATFIRLGRFLFGERT